MPELSAEGETIFRGIPVSGGVSRGKILVIGRRESEVPRREISISEIPVELLRFEHALLETRQEILEVQKQLSDGLGASDASIFDAHLLVLEDPILIEEVSRLVSEKKLSAEFAFHQFSEKYAITLSKIDDDYLRERVADIRDVCSRVLNNLLGFGNAFDLRHLKEPSIIITEDLMPSTTAQLDRKMVLGFATDIGSKTSHTAIMARSLEIPAVVGFQDLSKQLQTGQFALLDGFNGLIILNPTDATLFQYGQLVKNRVSLREKLKDVIDKPAITLDGHKITLSANIEKPSDSEMVKSNGGEGVGLFRTEYLFINRDTLPTEEEQYQAYRAVAVALKPQSVVIRTLDLGGDKFLTHLPVPQEMNPFLGWRAIRFCLEEKEIFRTQLRALLRASTEGNIKIMYPMISCIEELDRANDLVEQFKEELRSEGLPFQEDLEIGVMIEIPSAALIANSLAKKAKFFSIGTNDLIQYSLAVDRLNEKIAHLYEPTHPAILHLIKMTVDAAHRNGIWVGVCGEMAGDPVLATLLVGLGVDDLSATPSAIPQLKFMIRKLKVEEARKLAEFALNCDSGKEILRRAESLAREIAPSLFDTQKPFASS